MTTIKLKHSATDFNVPESLAAGELAINEADRILFHRDPNGDPAAWHFDESLIASGSVSNVGSIVLQLPYSIFRLFHLHIGQAYTNTADYDDYLYMRLSNDGGSTWAETGYARASVTTWDTDPWYWDSYGADTGMEISLMSTQGNSWQADAWLGFPTNNGLVFNSCYTESCGWWTDSSSLLHRRSTSKKTTTYLTNAIMLYSSYYNFYADYALYGVARS